MFEHDIWPQNYSIERIDNPEGRVYNINSGEHEYPSITTVLSTMDGDWLQEWIDQVGEEYAKARSKKALTIGTALHEFCEDYLLNSLDKKKLIKALPEVRVRFNNFKSFLNTIESVHLLERPLYSTILGVAGTVDCMATIDSKLTIVDFKTSFKEKEHDQIQSYFSQAAFYSCAVAELYQLRSLPRICIAIAVDGIKEPQVFFEDPKDHIPHLLEAIKNYKNETLNQKKET